MSTKEIPRSDMSPTEQLGHSAKPGDEVRDNDALEGSEDSLQFDVVGAAERVLGTFNSGGQIGGNQLGGGSQVGN